MRKKSHFNFTEHSIINDISAKCDGFVRCIFTNHLVRKKKGNDLKLQATYGPYSSKLSNKNIILRILWTQHNTTLLGWRQNNLVLTSIIEPEGSRSRAGRELWLANVQEVGELAGLLLVRQSIHALQNSEYARVHWFSLWTKHIASTQSERYSLHIRHLTPCLCNQ